MKVEVAKIISNGMGIGWGGNNTFFIPFTLPGEIVEITSFEKKKNHILSTGFELLKSSPLRRKPICPLFMACGGCSIQHMNYSEQMDFKKKVFTEIMKQNKIFSFPDPVLLTPGETGLRTRTKIFTENGKLHYRAAKSHDLIEFRECPLLNPFFLEKIKEHSSFALKKGDTQFEYSSVTGDFMPQKSTMTKVVFDKEIALAEGSFFQSSEEGAEILVSLMLNTLAEKNSKTAYDLFCGCGLFSIFMVDKGIECTGIESSENAVKSFQNNLGKKASVLRSDIYRIKDLERKDIIVADPPRAGLDRKLINVIARSGVQSIIYISCEPSSFGRDASILLTEGYFFEKIYILDLFPDTHHFETFSVLNRIEI